MAVRRSWQRIEFLSTPSGWRATILFRRRCRTKTQFLSTPSGWRATHFSSSARSSYSGISIHALRVEGDVAVTRSFKDANGISIHALRVEGDPMIRASHADALQFLSTPSGWRATARRGVLLRYNPGFLSTPSGWRAMTPCHACFQLPVFLSTPSGWRATAKTDKVFVCFCAKGRRICLFKTRKEKNLPVAF